MTCPAATGFCGCRLSRHVKRWLRWKGIGARSEPFHSSLACHRSVPAGPRTWKDTSQICSAVILARLRSNASPPATASEKNLIKTESVCLGKGLTEAFQKVLAELPSATDQIDHSICDMNGEPYRADEYGFAVSRLAKRFVNASDFVAPADCWGDVGAASGPLFVSLLVAAGQRGYARATHNLVWTSSESGERCAAILHHADPTRN